MNYTLKEIAEICGGTIEGSPSNKNYIQSIAWDSRQLIPDSNTLFVAINGQNHNAHKFIPEIEKKGVQFFLVSKDYFTLETESKASFLVVDDSLKALQVLSAHHRSQFDLPVIGITGSNGKTTIKEWLGELLTPHLAVCKNPKSYNSKLGVPLSLLQINSKHQLGIFETGISQANEMQLLADLIQPEYSLFTNLGAAHDEGFKSRVEKRDEKMLLLANSKCIFLVEEESELNQAITETLNNKTFIKLGTSEHAFIQTINIDKTTEGHRFNFRYEGTEQELIIPFSDHAAVKNVLYCILVYIYFRKSTPTEQLIKDLQKSLYGLSPLKMRLEIVDGAYNSSIINDTYTNDLDSLEVAIQHLIRHNRDGRKIIILSDLLQLNLAESEEHYKYIASKIKSVKPALFIGIGDSIQQVKSPLSKAGIKTTFFDSKESFKKEIDLRIFEQSSILIKGARAFEFEELVDFIAEKNHRTYLEINLNNIRENLSFFKSIIGTQCKTLVMVKAEAYGGGDHEIARLLEQERIDYLGVAYVDEGIKLRNAGIQSPILVLNVSNHEMERCLNYRLEPEIHSIDQFQTLQKVASSSISPFYFHLKIETGMNRLGFTMDQLDNFTILYKESSNVKLKSVFSHLASSESDQEIEFTRMQYETFMHSVEFLESRIETAFDKHILNTAGISKYPEMKMDMVRLGIGLYGLGNNPKIQEHLKMVFTLKANVTSISKVKAGSTVGYGRMGKLDEDAIIATISIGYADGLLRKAGNQRFKVKINEQYYPLIGNVCMDMCMVNLGKQSSVKVGDEVIIFDDAESLNMLTKALDTIPYEVLTNISQRVRRKYIQD